MINPLKVATGGYLKRQTKAVLIIAVAGYLNFQGTPIPPTPPSGGGGGGCGGGYTSYETVKDNREEERKKKIEEDNKFIIEFLKTATDIINNQ